MARVICIVYSLLFVNNFVSCWYVSAPSPPRHIPLHALYLVNKEVFLILILNGSLHPGVWYVPSVGSVWVGDLSRDVSPVVMVTSHQVPGYVQQRGLVKDILKCVLLKGTLCISNHSEEEEEFIILSMCTALEVPLSLYYMRLSYCGTCSELFRCLPYHFHSDKLFNIYIFA